MTTSHLNRICKGWHGANINGHLVTVSGAKGAWAVSVDGELLTENAANLIDAEMTAELHIMGMAA